MKTQLLGQGPDAAQIQALVPSFKAIYACPEGREKAINELARTLVYEYPADITPRIALALETNVNQLIGRAFGLDDGSKLLQFKINPEIESQEGAIEEVVEFFNSTSTARADFLKAEDELHQLYLSTTTDPLSRISLGSKLNEATYHLSLLKDGCFNDLRYEVADRLLTRLGKSDVLFRLVDEPDNNIHRLIDLIWKVKTDHES